MTARFISLPFIGLVTFFTIFLASGCLSPVMAQEGVPTDQTYDQFLKNIDKAEKTGVQNTDSYMGGVVFNRVILGITRILGGSLASSDPNKDDQGLVGVATNLMGATYAYQPASAVAYFQDLGRSAHLISPAYAQDTNIQGFNRLSTLLPLWKAMRNLAYLLYIPIFIFVGISIMLRSKINPQTSASIQAAIPKIIVSLILVTFSFAIVGFMIDIMNFSMALIVNYFASQGFIKADNPLFGNDGAANIYSQNIFGIVLHHFNIVNLAKIPAQDVADIVSKVTPDVPGIKTFLDIGAKGFVTMVLLLAVVYVLFRVLITLIQAYIGILLMTVMGPLLIVFDAIPGRSGFNFWFKSILANLVVFPAVLTLLLFASVVGNAGSIVSPDNPVTFTGPDGFGWKPPFLGSFAGNGVETFMPFIAFGALLMMPTMLGQLQKFLKTQVNLGSLFEPVQQAAAPVMNFFGKPAGYGYEQSPVRAQREAERTRANLRAKSLLEGEDTGVQVTAGER